jgi:hypothetical protein
MGFLRKHPPCARYAPLAPNAAQCGTRCRISHADFDERQVLPDERQNMLMNGKKTGRAKTGGN